MRWSEITGSIYPISFYKARAAVGPLMIKDL